MRRTAAALLLTGGLVLTGCSSGSSGSAAGDAVPTPVATIPVDVAGLSQTVGEYVVTPAKDLGADVVKAAVAKVSKLPGVQSAQLQGGKIHVVVLPDAKTTDREALERQLAALGSVAEGI